MASEYDLTKEGGNQVNLVIALQVSSVQAGPDVVGALRTEFARLCANATGGTKFGEN